MAIFVEAVHERARHAAGDAAFRLVDGAPATRDDGGERAAAATLDAAAVDLVAGGDAAVAEADGHLRRDLVARERGRHGQKAEAGDVALLGLDAVGIADALAEHLVAAAHAVHAAAGARARNDRVAEAAAAQPRQIFDGALGAGHD